MNQVLTLDNGGRPSRWTRWEDALVYLVTGRVAWSLGDQMPYRGGLCRSTGKDTVVHVPNIIAVTNEVLAERVPLTNRNLFQRDDHRCGYCGRRFPFSELTREHIIPRARGGPDIWTNVITADKRCNSFKACRTPEEAGMQLLWVPYVPNKAEELILSSRSIQPDQRDYLKDCLPKNSPIRARFA